jgi:GNAT superfamily N-acetyltransferase
MRTTLSNYMKKHGFACRCVRCREVKRQDIDVNTAVLKTRIYKASRGVEYFLSFETDDEKTIFGFLRLRLAGRAAGGFNKNLIATFPELVNCALLREIHIYGKTVKINEKNSVLPQHVGFGTRLVHEAIKIAERNGYPRIGVINGVGTTNYYKKFGFEEEKNFMIKKLNPKIPGLYGFIHRIAKKINPKIFGIVQESFIDAKIPIVKEKPGENAFKGYVCAVYAYMILMIVVLFCSGMPATINLLF